MEPGGELSQQNQGKCVIDETNGELLHFDDADQEETIWSPGFLLFAALHLLCCGLPFLFVGGAVLLIRAFPDAWIWGGFFVGAVVAGCIVYIRRRLRSCSPARAVP